MSTPAHHEKPSTTFASRHAWEQEGVRLFGPDKRKWRFVCPSCRNVMSIERVHLEFLEQYPLLKGSGYAIEAECIGRYLDGVGCDWAAYGLFRGPVLVADGAAVIPCFAFDNSAEAR